MRLLALPPKVQKELEKGTISEGHGKVLLGVEHNKVDQLLESVTKEGLSVRALEKLLEEQPNSTKNKKEKSRDELNLESALSSKQVSREHHLAVGEAHQFSPGARHRISSTSVS